MIASAQTLMRLSPIVPMHPRTVSQGMTFGLSPAGYDIRLDQDVVLEPGDFLLASAKEYFEMPDILLGIVHDKSSLARKGVSVFNTVIEPGWKGYLTLELKNQGHKTLYLGKGSPIAQVVFHMLDEPTQMPYNGRYQNQASGPQAPIEADAQTQLELWEAPAMKAEQTQGDSYRSVYIRSDHV